MSPPNRWRTFVTKHGGPVLQSHGFVRVGRTTGYRRDWQKSRSAWVRFVSTPRFRDSEVAFQIIFGFLVPTAYRRLEGSEPTDPWAFSLYDTWDHDCRHFLDLAGNVWEFSNDDKLAEFIERLDDLGRRLAAVGDDLRLLIEGPNEVDPFPSGAFTASRMLLREEFTGVPAELPKPHASSVLGWFEVGVDLETSWGDPRFQTYDYSFIHDGTLVGEGELITSDAKKHPYRYLADTGLSIQVDEATAAAVGIDARLCRRLGLGRVRKDWSTPLYPPAERIWIQDALQRPTLVLRPQEDQPIVFFPLPEQTRPAWGATVARVDIVLTTLVIGDEFLPAATGRGLERARIAKRAWGGLVAATTEAPPDA